MSDTIMGVRPEVLEATRFTKDPGTYTLGELAQWSANLQTMTPFSVTEEELVSEQWVRAIVLIKERELLSNLGGLAYIVDQEAQLLLRKKEQE